MVVIVTAGLLGPDDLRVKPRGSRAHLRVSDDLDGPIRSLGERFWNAIRHVDSDLDARLTAGDHIREFSYVDRYIYSPLVMRCVLEIIRGLGEASTGFDADTSKEVVTTEARWRSGSPEWLNHDWRPDVDKSKIFSEALARLKMNGMMKIGDRRKVPHARTMKLIWDDGAVRKLHLDEGLGFLECRGQRHDFHQSEDRQGAKLIQASYNVNSRGVTYFYLFPLTHSE